MLRRKLTEFLALKQGNNNVLQYSQAFNTLSQYAGYHVDTDEKKQACFRQGLSSKLKRPLIREDLNVIPTSVPGG